MRFLAWSDVKQRVAGKSVAIVGSGPGCRGNEPGVIDGHDLVARINNYRLMEGTGSRTDIFYSFFGNSIRKEPAELQHDGVTLCMCKCPDAHAIESEWHRRNGKMLGVDFRWIYEKRRNWWFCDTYVPDKATFLETFSMLDGHVPTTGFAAIVDIIRLGPARVFLTGFDFFESGLHNVTDRWRRKNADDPIGHVPEREKAWLKANLSRYPITVDVRLAESLADG